MKSKRSWRRRIVGGLAVCALGGLVVPMMLRAAEPAKNVAAEKGAADTASFRIRFGMKETKPSDWTGKISVSNGKVESVSGWRWMPGDKYESGAFTIGVRRAQAQGSGDKSKVAAGGLMPMTENGVILNLSGVKPDTEVVFESAQGKESFKISDVPLGQPSSRLNGNLEIERVPNVAPLADTIQDEDYPTVATGKDGTMYMVYLAFTRGKDFQGERERPSTTEAGPQTGPLIGGEIRKIEKPEDLDYLAQPAGGEQLFLRMFRNGAWSEPVAVTDGKMELYRPAVALDGSGRVWVIYSAHVDAGPRLDKGDWELMARSFDANGGAPTEPVNISNTPGSDFMPAAATDSAGKVYVVWIGQRGTTFSAMVSHQDGAKFSAPQRLTQSPGNEWEPAIAADAKGNVAVAYDTYEKGDYDVYVARRGKDGSFEKPQPVAATLGYEVRPSMVYDNKSQLWIAYEESGDQWGKDFGALKKKGIPIYAGGRSLGLKVLDEGGKWMTPPDVMAAMPAAGAKRARAKSAAPGASAVTTNIAPGYPRLAADPQGRIWLSFRGKPGVNWRTGVGSVWCEFITQLDSDGWMPAAWVPRSNNVLDNRPAIATNAKGDLMLAFSGDGRGEINPPKVGDPHLRGTAEGSDVSDEIALDNAQLFQQSDDDVPNGSLGFAATAAAGKKKPAAADAPAGKKKQGGGGKRNIGDENQDIYVAWVGANSMGKIGNAPQLQAAKPAEVASPSADTLLERGALKSIRDYRVDLNGEKLQIWRGEFHRHTEYSPDGGNDGGILELWRYAIDAVNNDWIGDGDHDYGVGREYTWWTTQKLVTMFTIPNKFTPVFSYERSVSYPEGHRNCMFAERGIRSLPRMPITSPDKFAPAPDTNLLYMYLHHFKGLCASHTSATNMGTDWRNNDPEVEPLVEIYQGDRNSYERPDAPRSAVTEAKLKQSTPDKESLGGWQPKGFVNLALKKGYRLGFESSSDHMSTHLSYCSLFVKDTSRQGVLDAVRQRRSYAATDNIIADVQCKVGDKMRFMGEEFSTSDPVKLNIHFVGAGIKINKVTIIKDDEEVKVFTPNAIDVKLEWQDPNPTKGKTSYYYVRAEQAPDMEGVTSGELCWASPMWIKYEGK